MALTLQDTRLYHLSNMLLLDRMPMKPLEIIKSLGYLQLDTIFVVARSHNLVLHTRNWKYEDESIWSLFDKRKIFEEFAHARSLLPIEEFPYYYRIMLERRKTRPDWFDRIKDAEELIDEVLTQIDDKGELATSELELDTSIDSRWSSLGKGLLDHLAHRGYIQISRREKYSKVYYQRIEEVIPTIPDEDDLPNRLEVFWYDIFKTIDTHGVIPHHRLLHYMYNQRYFYHDNKRYSPRKLVNDAIKQDKIEEIALADHDLKFYCRPGYTETHEVPVMEEKHVWLLSPFDNALWCREMLEAQYNYSYKFEAYTPKKDRIYGPYALPILYGTEFVGRVDPKLDRENSKMMLRQWSWERGFQPTPAFWDELALTVEQFVKFHQATEIAWGDLKASYRKELQQRLSL